MVFEDIVASSAGVDVVGMVEPAFFQGHIHVLFDRNCLRRNPQRVVKSEQCETNTTNILVRTLT
jgi:hypothetical protein